MNARSLMVQGTGSSVGKSLLVTALCRIFARKGIRVAPFKSQNMSLNSFTTEEGLEMGRAQVVQAEAAGITPSALMNPVLLKPSGEKTSQVIVHGTVRASMDAHAYHRFKASLVPEVQSAYTALAEKYDLILIEGAGSPAEINLRENDLANMGMAALAKAPVILAADIDRGGVFASLYGTVKLLESEEQARIRGLVINKFRGDPAILEPGLRQIEYILAKPVLGVLPYLDLHVDEEDSLTERLLPAPAKPGDVDVAVIRLPRMANFTDFAVFDLLEGVSLRFVHSARELGRPDLLIIPGSKNSQSDLRYLHESGLGGAIRAANAGGVPLVGICGGYQMLGVSIRDPNQVESALQETPGLGLLPMHTQYAGTKRTSQAQICVSKQAATLPLLCGTGESVLKGYEIHMGHSCPETPGDIVGVTSGKTSGKVGPCPFGRYPDGTAEGTALHGKDGAGDIVGTYVHGVFDNFAFTRALLNNLCTAKKAPPLPETASLAGLADYAAFRTREYDRLADAVEPCLDMAALERIIAGGA